MSDRSFKFLSTENLPVLQTQVNDLIGEGFQLAHACDKYVMLVMPEPQEDLKEQLAEMMRQGLIGSAPGEHNAQIEGNDLILPGPGFED
jgi:hypothetical protein